MIAISNKNFNQSKLEEVSKKIKLSWYKNQNQDFTLVYFEDKTEAFHPYIGLDTWENKHLQPMLKVEENNSLWEKYSPKRITLWISDNIQISIIQGNGAYNTTEKDYEIAIFKNEKWLSNTDFIKLHLPDNFNTGDYYWAEYDETFQREESETYVIGHFDFEDFHILIPQLWKHFS